MDSRSAPITIGGRRLTREEKLASEELSDYHGQGRPKTRTDCENVPRPCPYVSCKYNLYLDVCYNESTHSIKINFPHLEPSEMAHSCALDEIDESRGFMTLGEVGVRLNLTRERVRQLEAKMLRRFRNMADLEFIDMKVLEEIWDVIQFL